MKDIYRKILTVAAIVLAMLILVCVALFSSCAETDNEKETNKQEEEKKSYELPEGTFCSLSEVYEAGGITREDVMAMSYLRNGKVYEMVSYPEGVYIAHNDEETKELDYVYEGDIPALDDETALKIRKAYYAENEDDFIRTYESIYGHGYFSGTMQEYYGDEYGGTEIQGYYGTYNGYCVLKLYDRTFDYTTDDRCSFFDGIQFGNQDYIWAVKLENLQ